MTAPLVIVAPHATRTGSTRVLLELLRSAAADLPVPIQSVVQAGGPLLAELEALAPPERAGQRPAAVLVNTCLAAGYLAEVPSGIPTAVYVHEPIEVVESLPADALAGVRQAGLVLCVSETAREDLVGFGIESDRVRVVPPLIVPRADVGAEARAAARTALGIPDGTRLVLGCGEGSERKGTDLFVEVGVHLIDRPTVHLAWVGRRLRAGARQLDHDVEATGLAERFHWLDEVPDTAPFLAAADVVVMASRSDPQSLVPLEAAQQGTPTVAFALDGHVDLVAAGAALAVPFPDTQALAGLVARVLDEPATAAALVTEAQRRTREMQSPATVVPRFLAVVRELLAGDPPRRS